MPCETGRHVPDQRIRANDRGSSKTTFEIGKKKQNAVYPVRAVYVSCSLYGLVDDNTSSSVIIMAEVLKLCGLYGCVEF